MNQLLWIIICCISLRSSLRSSPINGQSAIRIWAVLSINISREDVKYLHILFIQLETSIDWPFTANYERCVICPEAVTSIATRAIMCDIAWYVMGYHRSVGCSTQRSVRWTSHHHMSFHSPFAGLVWLSQDSQHSSAEAAYRYIVHTVLRPTAAVLLRCALGLSWRPRVSTSLITPI